MDDTIIAMKLDAILTEIGEVKKSVGTHNDRITSIEFWRVDMEGRLRAGTERMNLIEKEAALEKSECKARFIEIEEKLKGYVRKEIVVAMLVGVSVGSGGIVAGLMHLLK